MVRASLAAREPVLVGPDGVTLRARIEVVGAVAVDHGDTFLSGQVCKSIGAQAAVA